MPEGVVGTPGEHPAAHAVLPEPGETIGGKYSVTRRLGEGGMAVVFEAMHLRLRQPIAIKVLRPDVADSHALMARFEREARATAQLRSVNAARVIDVDVLPGGLPFMVMELLEGNDLDVELQNTGAMIVVRAVDIVLQTTAAMQEAHSLGIVHRDLKPANLFLCPMADRVVVKVLDFGISKMEGDGTRLTQSNAYFGTPAYCSPEQLRDAAGADARSDVWSLGVILFELLTGRLPFEGGSPTAIIARVLTDPIPSPLELRPDLPPDLGRIVLRALDRDPAKRFQTMQEMAQALTPFGPARAAAAVLAEQQRGRGKLGEILVSEGLLTAADLEKALAEQRRTGKLLGKLLIEMELVSHADLLTALAKQQGIHPGGPGGGPPVPAPAQAQPGAEKRSRDQATAPPGSKTRAAAALPDANEEPSSGRRWLLLAVALGIPVGILVGLWAAGIIGH